MGHLATRWRIVEVDIPRIIRLLVLQEILVGEVLIDGLVLLNTDRISFLETQG